MAPTIGRTGVVTVRIRSSVSSPPRGILPLRHVIENSKVGPPAVRRARFGHPALDDTQLHVSPPRCVSNSIVDEGCGPRTAKEVAGGHRLPGLPVDGKGALKAAINASPT